MHLRRHIPPSCPDSQAAEALAALSGRRGALCRRSASNSMSGTPRPWVRQHRNSSKLDTNCCIQRGRNHGVRRSPGCNRRRAQSSASRTSRVPRRELTACSRCADHRQALCIGRMHRIAWTTRSLSSGAWTLRGRRRLSGVRTTPSVALSSPTARHLACACRRGEPRAKRCFAGISVCGRPRSCCPFAARDCACCA